MATRTVIPKADQEWRGRDAARTLAEAERIKADPVLSKLAAKEAAKMAAEQQQQAAAMNKVAKLIAPKAAKKTNKK
jgi:hypothetical protein